jgi:CMP-2-keto-3-deoxyoctulosonic acid synthetase
MTSDKHQSGVGRISEVATLVSIEFGKFPQSKLEIAERGVEPLRVMEKVYKLHAPDTTYTSIGVDTIKDLQKVIENLQPTGGFW